MRGDHDAWVRDEPRFVEVASHVLRKSLRRPMRVALLTLLMVAAITGYRLRKKPVYVGSAIMRISEGVTTGFTPPPPRSLLEYVNFVALNRSSLKTIMQKHGTRREPTQKQLDLFRDEIEVYITGNDFHEYLYDADVVVGARAVTLIIEYQATDPEDAVGVAHDVAAAVEAATMGAREQRAASTRAAYADAVALGHARLRELEDEERRAGAATRVGVLTSLELQKTSIQQRLDQLEQRAAEAELSASAEEQGIGLNFELVNEEVNVFGHPLTLTGAVILFLVLWLLILPIVAVASAAFDQRVYSREDLVLLEMPVLGVLPRWTGDAAGSLHDRLRRVARGTGKRV